MTEQQTMAMGPFLRIVYNKEPDRTVDKVLSLAHIVGEKRVFNKASDIQGAEFFSKLAYAMQVNIEGTPKQQVKAYHNFRCVFLKKHGINATGFTKKPKTNIEPLIAGTPFKSSDLAQRLNEVMRRRAVIEEKIANGNDDAWLYQYALAGEKSQREQLLAEIKLALT